MKIESRPQTISYLNLYNIKGWEKITIPTDTDEDFNKGVIYVLKNGPRI